LAYRNPLTRLRQFAGNCRGPSQHPERLPTDGIQDLRIADGIGFYGKRKEGRVRYPDCLGDVYGSSCSYAKRTDHPHTPATRPNPAATSDSDEHGVLLLDGSEIAIQPAQDLLDHFVPRHEVVRFVDLEPFVLGRRSQQVEHRLDICFEGEDQIIPAIQH
jgi:hypothetical protein